MHAALTAVTVQSNKIISNEVKDNRVLTGAILRKKTQRAFCPTQSYVGVEAPHKVMCNIRGSSV